MSKKRIDRVAEDLAAGRWIDWEAELRLAETDEVRRTLEEMRVTARIRAFAAGGSSVTVQALAAPRDVQTMETGPRLEPGQTWGRYALLEATGSGSFGTVYKAWEPAIRLQVAIKVLHQQVDSDLLRQRLIDEGRALAQISHPNVVRVLGIEFDGDRAGLCTEFIDGETLDAEVRRGGTFSQAQAIEVGEAVCQALAAVHQANFIHRDVKARNVMRQRNTGRIVLMDFGAGRELEEELNSPAFEFAGTALYMAPEVLEYQRASKSSDVYSVGVLLYHLLTGAYPVEGRTLDELRTAHRRGLRTPLGDRRSDLPPAFVRVIEKALAPSSSRYLTPAALCADLEAVRTARPPWLRRLKVVGGATAIGLAAITVLGFINTHYFNSVLGRADFVDEGLLDWVIWGGRGVLAPIVVAALTMMVVTLLIECAQLLTRVSARARQARDRLAALIHRTSLDDVATLSSVSFLASAAALFAVWWYFTPLFTTLTSIDPDISTVALDTLRPLSPENTAHHVLYRKSFVGTTIACVMLWYPTLRLAWRTRQRVPRRSIIGGSIVFAFSLLLLDFPYRLLTQDVTFDEVTWQGQHCYLLGARNDDRLVFCPSLPIPRNRTVPAAVLTPIESPAVGLREEGGAAKMKKSIFRFLLAPEVAADKGHTP